MTLAELNDCSPEQAFRNFLDCCHCRRWALAMSAARPYATLAELQNTAVENWKQASEKEILEAFGGHARIGDMDRLRDRFSVSHAEQGQVCQADDSTLEELMRLNEEYEKRHGFIFIVCASGRPATEMLELLRRRLPNSRPQELINGAGEQEKITALRLQKLLSHETGIQE